MHLLEDGMSFGHTHKKYGINEDRLKVLWARYQEKGLDESRNIKADFVLMKKIVIDIEENHLTLQAASLKYGASPQRICCIKRCSTTTISYKVCHAKETV